MRYYLDTNILIFLLWNERDELSDDTWAILSDYENQMLTSTVCVHELIHLFQIGKLPLARNGRKANAEDIAQWLEDMDVKVKPVLLPHLISLARLPLFSTHRDPNDRLIIAQAINERVPLVSSDHKFSLYQSQGLDFVFNER